MRWAGVVVAAIAVTIPGAACGGSARSTLHMRLVASGLDSPVYVTAPRGERGKLYVVEQPGVIRVLVNGRLQPQPFLDIHDMVKSGGEQGLLSLAFHPNYAKNHRFFVYFNDTSGDVRVYEYRSNGTIGLPGTGKSLLLVPHREFDNHNGGQLQFGPDGLLYAGTGDGGGGGDPHGNAQNRASNLGKMLRIDPRQPGAQPEQFAIGLRNPWRFSFDRQTGDLAIADVGQDTVEEVDFAPAPGRGQGANYGWNRFEGNNVYTGTGDRTGVTFPVITHTHSDGWCSITGGYVVRDPTLPELAGRYVYGDYC